MHQNGDAADRNLSREERKMLAYMRQFEQMEKKEQAKTAPVTPRPEGKCGDRGEKEDSVEADGSASLKKRKEAEEDDLASARKKPRSEDDKPTNSPRGAETADCKSAVAPKPRGRPPNKNLTGKQKLMAEKEAVGALVALRRVTKSHDGSHPVRPCAAGQHDPAPVLSNEWNAARKCMRFAGGKKRYCWVQAQLADLSEQDPHEKCAVDWLPSSRTARLNPHRRMVDKKRFPVIKSHLARWTFECQIQHLTAEAAAKSAAARLAAASRRPEVKTEMTADAYDADIKMEEETAPDPEAFVEAVETEAVKTEVAKMEMASPSAAGVNMEKGEGEDPSATFDAAPDTVKIERGEEARSLGADDASCSKAEVRIPRREQQHGDPDRPDSDRHGPSNPSMSNYPGTERMRFRDAPSGGGGITTGYGSLAITIPVGGLPHNSHYGWDQRSRISEISPLVKNDGAAQDLGGNNDKRWPRAADSPGMWMGKRDGPGPGPSPASLAGPNSPSKGSSAAAAGSWDRGRERSTEARSSKDTDQDSRWQRGKDSPGHWIGKREGSGLAPMPSSPRVGDSSANWGPRGSSRASAWDQPPLPGEIVREQSSKDGSIPERDLDRSSAIRNLPDMREMRREPSPPPMRRRVPTPPRSMYSVDMRDRGMDVGGGGGGGGGSGGGGGGGGGGLSRESLRREREDALLRDREPPERDPPPRFMRSEIVRSEIVRSEIRSNASERASDSPRSRAMLNQWDLGPRARSPRPLDRCVRPVSPCVTCFVWSIGMSVRSLLWRALWHHAFTSLIRARTVA
jgi:hypothetical protein